MIAFGLIALVEGKKWLAAVVALLLSDYRWIQMDLLVPALMKQGSWNLHVLFNNGVEVEPKASVSGSATRQTPAD